MRTLQRRACGECVSIVVAALEVRLGLAELMRRCKGSYFASIAPASGSVVNRVQEELGQGLVFLLVPCS
jgi:hypothetical protein